MDFVAKARNTAPMTLLRVTKYKWSPSPPPSSSYTPFRNKTIMITLKYMT